MKDYSKEVLEESRPKIDVLDGINFALDRLYSDKEKNITDCAARGMSYEELIGVLLLARDEIEEVRRLENMSFDEEYSEDDPC